MFSFIISEIFIYFCTYVYCISAKFALINSLFDELTKRLTCDIDGNAICLAESILSMDRLRACVCTSLLKSHRRMASGTDEVWVRDKRKIFWRCLKMSRFSLPNTLLGGLKFSRRMCFFARWWNPYPTSVTTNIFCITSKT